MSTLEEYQTGPKKISKFLSRTALRKTSHQKKFKRIVLNVLKA